MRHRLLGVVLVFVSGLCAYMGIYQPLQAAERHERFVSFWIAGSFFCPAFLTYGIAYMIWGKETKELLGTHDFTHPVGKVLAIILAIIGCGIFLWLRMALQARGYQL